MKKLHEYWKELTVLFGLVLVAVGMYMSNEVFYTRRLLQLDRKLVVAAARSESLQIQLARARLGEKAFRELYNTSQALNGVLIAAANVRVKPKTVVRDTVRLVTTVQVQGVDTTRVATVHDSTSVGLLTATVTAPPCCAPLTFQYTYTTAPITVGVGFIRRGTDTYAVVTGDTTQVTLTASHWKVPKVQQPRLQPWLFVGPDVFRQRVAVVAGVDVRVLGPLQVTALTGPQFLAVGGTWRF